MYEKIAARKSVPQLYEEKLIVSKFLYARFLRLITVCSSRKIY